MNICNSCFTSILFNDVEKFVNKIKTEVNSRINDLFQFVDPFSTKLLQKPIDKSVQFPFDNHFDKTLIINLEKATKKKEILSNHLDSIGVNNWERFNAVNGYALADNYLPIENCNVTFKDFYSRMPGASIQNKKARAGCYLSHLNSLKTARAKGLNSVLILEDDAMFAQNKHAAKIFEKTMKELPADWEMLFLGFQHYKNPTHISPNLDKVEAGMCMHAYAVHSRCFDRAIKDLESWIRNSSKQMQPVDAVISELFEKQQYKAYSPRELISFQRDDLISDITGNSNQSYSFIRNIALQAFKHVVTPILNVFGVQQYHIYNAATKLNNRVFNAAAA